LKNNEERVKYSVASIKHASDITPPIRNVWIATEPHRLLNPPFKLPHKFGHYYHSQCCQKNCLFILTRLGQSRRQNFCGGAERRRTSSTHHSILEHFAYVVGQYSCQNRSEFWRERDLQSLDKDNSSRIGDGTKKSFTKFASTCIQVP